MFFFYSVYQLVSPSHATQSHEEMLKVDSEATSSDSIKIGTSVVKLLHDSLEPIRLHAHRTNAMGGSLKEENASKQCQFSVKRKRKKPPR